MLLSKAHSSGFGESTRVSNGICPRSTTSHFEHSFVASRRRRERQTPRFVHDRGFWKLKFGSGSWTKTIWYWWSTTTKAVVTSFGQYWNFSSCESLRRQTV